MNKQTIIPTIGLLFSLSLPLTATAQTQPKFDDVNFYTANQNILCYGRLIPDEDNDSWVECNINSSTDSIKIKKILQPKPKSCKTQWGAAFSVDKNKKAQLICTQGDEVPSAVDKVSGEYNTSKQIKAGQIIRGDGWACTGLNDGGIMCKNNKGNGFSIGKNKQSIFNPN